MTTQDLLLAFKLIVSSLPVGLSDRPTGFALHSDSPFPAMTGPNVSWKSCASQWVLLRCKGLTKCTIFRVCRKWSPLAISSATLRAMPEFGSGLESAVCILYQWYLFPCWELMALYRSPFSRYSVTKIVCPTCMVTTEQRWVIIFCLHERLNCSYTISLSEWIAHLSFSQWGNSLWKVWTQRLSRKSVMPSFSFAKPKLFGRPVLRCTLNMRRRVSYRKTSSHKLHNIFVMAALEDTDLLLELGSVVGRSQGSDGPPSSLLLEHFHSHYLDSIPQGLVNLQFTSLFRHTLSGDIQHFHNHPRKNFCDQF